MPGRRLRAPVAVRCTHVGGALGKQLITPRHRPYERLMLNSVLRGLAAASLALLPLTAPPPAHAAETLPLAEAVTRLPVDTESRDGYDRDAFRHWNTGDDPSDGCNTRAEVLLSEAVEPPTVGPRCRLVGRALVVVLRPDVGDVGVRPGP